jgi:hypothetical protein
MQKLSLDHAHKYVLQALDEIRNLEDDVMLGESDDLDTRKMTSGYIIEAVLKSHKDAPSQLLDGVSEESDFEVDIKEDQSVEITMLEESARLVSLKASDSPYVVVDYATEESPIGRMQKNQYVRGEFDDPRLIVKKNWKSDRKPEYIYYSLSPTRENKSFALEYIPYPVVEDDAVLISDKMEYAVLSLLVSMVLDSLSLHDKATLYKNKYQEYLLLAR